jgi:hypothetical protein
MLCRLLGCKGENELGRTGTERSFHSIPKLYLKRNIARMIAQRFEELLESFSHDRPLPDD